MDGETVGTYQGKEVWIVMILGDTRLGYPSPFSHIEIKYTKQYVENLDIMRKIIEKI